ncbi:hypothetical protein [uncultured Eubacterium sp.]|uniref:hypothetical protein n=1 Tax=uncultured Eubacterium sp. TaxID=165185 RepID=UPI002599F9D7|nr:hypothetical protein [uncultured Eubacterium sp.]
MSCKYENSKRYKFCTICDTKHACPSSTYKIDVKESKRENNNNEKYFIENIKACGQWLIDNAEKLAEKYDFQTSLDIKCNVNFDEVPNMEVICNVSPVKYLI